VLEAVDTELEMYRELAACGPARCRLRATPATRRRDPLSGSGFFSVLFREDYSR
jgi:hypothetical protein